MASIDGRMQVLEEESKRLEQDIESQEPIPRAFDLARLGALYRKVHIVLSYALHYNQCNRIP